MADIFSKKERSRIMSRIRSRDTMPELLVDSWLCGSGFVYVRDCKEKTGRPDFYFSEFDGYLFIDGAFWHGHPDYFTFGKSGEFWDDKIWRNICRDQWINGEILLSGGRLLRIWDFEVLKRVFVEDMKEKVLKFAEGMG